MSNTASAIDAILLGAKDAGLSMFIEHDRVVIYGKGPASEFIARLEPLNGPLAVEQFRALKIAPCQVAADFEFNRIPDSVTECTESTQYTESSKDTSENSVNYDHSVYSANSVTPEQTEQLLQAIEDTVGFGASKRNSGVFRFARKMLAILGGMPDDDLIETWGLFWHEAAVQTIPNLDQGVVVAELDDALAKVTTPDDGSGRTALTIAMENCLCRPKPSFVKRLADDSGAVLLAKLVVELHYVNRGDEFALSSHQAGSFAGMDPGQALRILKRWSKIGILKLTKPGKPGPPGSPASRYRYLADDS